MASPEIVVSNLNYFINSTPHFSHTTTKHILHDINTTIRFGRLTAITGAMGSGKTSFLNILAQRINGSSQWGLLGRTAHVVTGNIEYPLAEIDIDQKDRQLFMRAGLEHDHNGRKRPVFIPTRTQTDELRVGYVKQHDFLLPYYTVRENLEMVAKLSLADLSPVDRESRIEFILAKLGLSTCQHTRVGSKSQNIAGISGGEARRVSIAVQLLKDPTVLFLDEPTTGLDTSSALAIVQLLSHLTKSLGMTIVISLHQPRNDLIRLFDDILLLAKGYVVYSGSVSHNIITSYFAQIGYPCPRYTNVSDFIIDICAADSRDPVRNLTSITRIRFLIQAWSNHYKSSKHTRLIASQVDGADHDSTALTQTARSPNDGFPTTSKFVAPAPPHSWAQFKQLSKRFALSMFRDRLSILGIFLQSLTLAVLVGFIFFQLNTHLADLRMRVSLMYLSNTILPYVSLVLQIYMQTIELNIFDNDQEENLYHPHIYGLARLAVFIPIVSLVSVLSVTIMGFMARIRGSPGYNSLVDINSPAGALATVHGDGADFLLWLVFAGLAPPFFILPFSMLVTAISRSFATASLIANSFYTILSFSCGFFIRDTQIPIWLQWTKYISYIYHSLHALITVQFSGQNFPCPYYDPSDPSSIDSPLCAQFKGSFLLRQYGVLEPHKDWILWHLLVIIGLGLAVGIAAILVLSCLKPNNMAPSLPETNTQTRLDKMTGKKNDKTSQFLDGPPLTRAVAYLDNISFYPRAYQHISQQLFISAQRQWIAIQYKKTLLLLAKQLRPSLFVHNLPELTILSVDFDDPNDSSVSSTMLKQELFSSGILSSFKPPSTLHAVGGSHSLDAPSVQPQIQLLNTDNLKSTHFPKHSKHQLLSSHDRQPPQDNSSLQPRSTHDSPSPSPSFQPLLAASPLPKLPTLQRSQSTNVPSTPRAAQKSNMSFAGHTNESQDDDDHLTEQHDAVLLVPSPHTSDAVTPTPQSPPPTTQSPLPHTPQPFLQPNSPDRPQRSPQLSSIPFEHRVLPALSSVHPTVLAEMLLEELLDFTVFNPQPAPPISPLNQITASDPRESFSENHHQRRHSGALSSTASFTSRLSRVESELSSLFPRVASNFSHQIHNAGTQSPATSQSTFHKNSNFQIREENNDPDNDDDDNCDDLDNGHEAETGAAFFGDKIYAPRLSRRGADGIMLDGQYNEKTADFPEKQKRQKELEYQQAQERLRQSMSSKSFKIVSNKSTSAPKVDTEISGDAQKSVAQPEGEKTQLVLEPVLGPLNPVLNPAALQKSATPQKKRKAGAKRLRERRFDQVHETRMLNDLDWEKKKETIILQNDKAYSFWSKWTANFQKQTAMATTSATQGSDPSPSSPSQDTAALNNQTNVNKAKTAPGSEIGLVITSFNLLIPIVKKNIFQRCWDVIMCSTNKQGHKSTQRTPQQENSETSPEVTPSSAAFESTALFTQHALDNEALFDSILVSFPRYKKRDQGVRAPATAPNKYPTNLSIPPEHQSIIDRCIPPLPDWLIGIEHRNEVQQDFATAKAEQVGTSKKKKKSLDDTILYHFAPSQLFSSLTHIKNHCLPLHIINGELGPKPHSNQQSDTGSDQTKNLSFDPEYEAEHSNQQIALVKNLCSTMRAGTSWLILGASGSGKTSFLRYLTNQLSKQSYDIVGDVYFTERIQKSLPLPTTNDTAPTPLSAVPTNPADPDQITALPQTTFIHSKFNTNRYVGYLNQHPTFLPMLTVTETLQFAADFSLHHLTQSQRKARVVQVIRQLNLIDCQHSIVGGGGASGNENAVKSISGGQKRLLSIGVVLLLDPCIWLADEPTSGLDAFSSSVCCDLLVDLALTKKRLVVATLHQPRFNDFAKFQNVIILAKSNVIYSGSITNLVPYFHSIPFIPRIDHITKKAVALTPNDSHQDVEPDNDEGNLIQQSPADWALDLVAIDFSLNPRHVLATTKRILVLAKIFWYRQQYVKNQVGLLIRTINFHKLTVANALAPPQPNNPPCEFPPNWNNDPIASKRVLTAFSSWLNQMNAFLYHQEAMENFEDMQDLCSTQHHHDRARSHFTLASPSTSTFQAPNPLSEPHLIVQGITDPDNLAPILITSGQSFHRNSDASSLQDRNSFQTPDLHPRSLPSDAVMINIVDHTDPFGVTNFHLDRHAIASPINLNLSPDLDRFTLYGSNRDQPQGNNFNEPIQATYREQTQPDLNPDEMIELVVCRYCGIDFSLTSLNLPCIATLHSVYLDSTSSYAMINDYLLSKPSHLETLVKQSNNISHSSLHPTLSPHHANTNLSLVPTSPNDVHIIPHSEKSTTSFEHHKLGGRSLSSVSFSSLQSSNMTLDTSESALFDFSGGSPEPEMESGYTINSDIKTNVRASIDQSTFINMRELVYKLNSQYYYCQIAAKNKSSGPFNPPTSLPTPSRPPQTDPYQTDPSFQNFQALLSTISVPKDYVGASSASPLLSDANTDYIALYAQTQLIQTLLLSNYHLLNSSHHLYYKYYKPSPNNPIFLSKFAVNREAQNQKGVHDAKSHSPTDHDQSSVLHQFIKLTVHKASYERSLRIVQTTIDSQYAAMLEIIDSEVLKIEDRSELANTIFLEHKIDLSRPFPYYYQKQCLQGHVSTVGEPKDLSQLRTMESVAFDKITQIEGQLTVASNPLPASLLPTEPVIIEETINGSDCENLDNNTTDPVNNASSPSVPLSSTELKQLKKISSQLTKREISVQDQFQISKQLQQTLYPKPEALLEQPQTTGPTHSKHFPPFWTSYKLLLFRQLKHGLRIPDLFFTRFSQIVAFSAIVCIFFWNLKYNLSGLSNRMGSFSLLMSATSVGLLNSVSLFPQERNMYYSEAHTDMALYQPFAFMLSYATIELFWTTFSSLIAAVVLTFAVSYSATESFWRYLVIAYTISTMATFGESLAMLFFVVVFHVGFTISLVTTLISLFDMCAGVITIETNLIWPVRVLNKIAPHWYAVRLLAVSDLYDHPVDCFSSATDPSNPCIYTNATEFLETFDMAGFWPYIWFLVLMMFMLNFIYRSVVFLILSFHVPTMSTGGGSGGNESSAIDIEVIPLLKERTVLGQEKNHKSAITPSPSENSPHPDTTGPLLQTLS